MNDRSKHFPRLRRRLLLVALILFVLSMVGAGGAPRRYNRIVYGIPPLALALVCLAAATGLPGSSPRVRRIAIAASILALALLAVWIRPSLAGAAPPDRRVERVHALLTLATDRLRADLFAELQPMELASCRLERFGDPHDGGYLLCANLLASAQSVYSYGIDGRDQWGCDVSRRVGVPVHEYDCFNVSRPACADPHAVFHEECVGPVRRTDQAGRIFDSLENQFVVNGDGTKRLVVKMDVEGAEWETLLKAPAAVLQRIDQLVVELHGIGLEQHLATVRRLKEFFHVAHVHFNNVTCAERIDPFPATTYEVLFVNKRTATATGTVAPRSNLLDAPNDPNAADCQAPASRWSPVVPPGLRFRLLPGVAP